MPAASFIEVPRSRAATGLRGVLGRLTALWPVKLRLYGLLFLVFGVPYFVLQRWPVFEPGRFDLLAVDEWVGFVPGWIWVYQSVYLLISLPPLLSERRGQLAVYTRGFLWMTGVAVAFYAFLPIEAPRPPDVPRDGMWGILLMYDRTINTFPSLHVAMAAHSLCFGAWLLGEGHWPLAGRIAMGGGVIWLVLIMYSTLATKQHYAVDLPAGVALGMICQRLGLGFRWRMDNRTLEGSAA